MSQECEYFPQIEVCNRSICDKGKCTLVDRYNSKRPTIMARQYGIQSISVVDLCGEGDAGATDAALLSAAAEWLEKNDQCLVGINLEAGMKKDNPETILRMFVHKDIDLDRGAPLEEVPNGES